MVAIGPPDQAVDFVPARSLLGQGGRSIGRPVDHLLIFVPNGKIEAFGLERRHVPLIQMRGRPIFVARLRSTAKRPIGYSKPRFTHTRRPTPGPGLPRLFISFTPGRPGTPVPIFAPMRRRLSIAIVAPARRRSPVPISTPTRWRRAMLRIARISPRRRWRAMTGLSFDSVFPRRQRRFLPRIAPAGIGIRRRRRRRRRRWRIASPVWSR